MGAPRTTPKVLQALRDREGKPVTVAEIAKATRLSNTQVTSAISRLIVRDRIPIEVISRGAVWRLPADEQAAELSTGPRVGDTFSVIGLDGNGNALVKGSGPQIFRLTNI